MSSYTFFDVETPNRNNDRICAIGVERCNENGAIEYSQHFFVNPEQGFDRIATGVHHISPSQVKGQPTFAQLWGDELSSVAADSIAVAHNAPFDLSVLGKTLDFYDLAKPELHFIDTCAAAKSLLTLPDYQLPTVCSHYGIDLLNHHDAMADTHACEEIYKAMANDFGREAFEIKPYVWIDYDPGARKDESCDQLMTDLYGIALGLSADMIITPAELNGLRDWMERNKSVRKSAFIKDAYALLENALDDGVLTQQEHEQILNLTRPFVQNSRNKAETAAMQELIGFLRGISCDEKINVRETATLQAWMNELQVTDDPNFDAVRTLITRVLADGVINADEETELLSLFDRIINPLGDKKEESEAVAATGFSFAGKRFVVTGDFEYGGRDEVIAAIESRGGEVAKGVSGKVDYVVMGSLSSPLYAYGNYGTKVKKAMELQDAGKPIQIIQEEQLGL